MIGSPAPTTDIQPEKSSSGVARVPAWRPLRVLIVEDNDDDAAIIVRLLRRGGYEPTWTQVQTAEAYATALARENWDIILSDFSLPHFDGLRALQAARSHAPYMPFIVISGSIGEETAVEVMRAGANDYLMKTNLARLVPAIEREMRESAERRERARTKNELVDLQEKFELIFDEYADVMIVLDAFAGDILHVNHAITRVTGYEVDQLTGQPFLALWPVEKAYAAREMLETARRVGSALRTGVFPRRDGSTFPADMQANKVPWGRGEAIIVTLRDVSEQQRAEQRLADEKEQLAVTLRSLGEGVITADTRGRLLLINGVAEHLTGWTQAEAGGRPTCEVLQLGFSTGGEFCEDYLESVLRSGEPFEISRDLVLRTRDGRERSIALTATPIRGQGGRINGVVTIFRDSTSEQKRDEELQRASKLESVALLAGGIAHDFNNILTAMLGHIALAQNHAAPAETVINSLEKACLHATDLTRQLLSFAKGNAPNRQVESIGAIVRESVDFALHGTALRGVFDIPPGGLHPVEVDRGQIHQVINNLVINATQATHDRGRLRVTVDNVAVTREQPVGTLAPGAYVRVSIEDNGTGIPPEHLTPDFRSLFHDQGNRHGPGSGDGVLHHQKTRWSDPGGKRTRARDHFFHLPAGEPARLGVGQPLAGCAAGGDGGDQFRLGVRSRRGAWDGGYPAGRTGG